MKFTIIFLTLLVSVYTKPLAMQKDDLINLSYKLKNIQQDLSAIEDELQKDDDVPNGDNANFDDLEYQSDNHVPGHLGSGLRNDDQKELISSLAQLDNKLKTLKENLEIQEAKDTKDDYIEDTPSDAYQSLEEQLEEDLETEEVKVQKDEKKKEKEDMTMQYFSSALKADEEEIEKAKDELKKLGDNPNPGDKKDKLDQLEAFRSRLLDLEDEIRAYDQSKADQKAAHGNTDNEDAATVEEDEPEIPTEPETEQSNDAEIIKNELGALPSSDAKSYAEAVNMFEDGIKSVTKDLEKSNDDSPSARADLEDKRQQLRDLEKQMKNLKDEIESRIQSKADHEDAIVNNNQEEETTMENDMKKEEEMYEEDKPVPEKDYYDEEETEMENMMEEDMLSEELAEDMEKDNKDGDKKYYQNMLGMYEDEMAGLKDAFDNYEELSDETKKSKISELRDLKKGLEDLQVDVQEKAEKEKDQTPVKDEAEIKKEQQVNDIDTMIKELSSLKDYIQKDQMIV